MTVGAVTAQRHQPRHGQPPKVLLSPRMLFVLGLSLSGHTSKCVSGQRILSRNARDLVRVLACAGDETQRGSVTFLRPCGHSRAQLWLRGCPLASCLVLFQQLPCRGTRGPCVFPQSRCARCFTNCHKPTRSPAVFPSGIPSGFRTNS